MRMFIRIVSFLLTIATTVQNNSENDLTQTPVLEMDLKENGFHRNLVYTVQFDYPLVGGQCKYLLKQDLPASVYVSVDQLADMQRLKKLDAFYPSFVDIEKPAEQSNDIAVFLKGVPKVTDTIILPIHLRYQAANNKSSFITVDISTPAMYINCPKHEQHFLESELKIEPNAIYCLDETVPNILEATSRKITDVWIEACNWKYVKTDIKLKSSLRIEIPVGNKDAFPIILYITIIISWIVSLWTVFRTRHIPLALNAKLEEQRLLQEHRN